MCIILELRITVRIFLLLQLIYFVTLVTMFHSFYSNNYLTHLIYASSHSQCGPHMAVRGRMHEIPSPITHHPLVGTTLDGAMGKRSLNLGSLVNLLCLKLQNTIRSLYLSVNEVRTWGSVYGMYALIMCHISPTFWSF